MKTKITQLFIASKERFLDKYINLENKYFDNLAIRKNTFMFSIVFFSIAMLALNCLTPRLVDDFAFGYINGTGTKIISLTDIITSMHNYYFLWGGRIWGEFYQQLFTLLGKPIFNIFNTIIYIVNTLLIYYICCEKKEAKVSLYIGVNLLIWFFTPDYGQVMLWMAGSSNYLWIITPILIMILIYRKYALNQNIIKSNLLNVIMIFILGVFAGWSSENGSAGMLVILTLYIIYFYFNNIKIDKYIISGYIGSLIGYVLLIAAPGNHVRKMTETATVHTTLIFRVFMITYFWVAYLFVIFIILAMIFFIGNRYFDFKKNNSVYQSAIFVVASFGAAFCMLAAPTSPERTWFSVVIYITISVGILYDKFDFKNMEINKKSVLMIRRLLFVSIIIASSNFFVMYLDTGMSTYELLAQTKEREQHILAEKAKGNLDISTPILSHKYPLLAHHDALYGLDDITQDPKHYANIFLARYYGIRSVTGIPAKEKQYLD